MSKCCIWVVRSKLTGKCVIRCSLTFPYKSSIDTEPLSSLLRAANKHFINQPPNVENCLISDNLDRSQNVQKIQNVHFVDLYTFVVCYGHGYTPSTSHTQNYEHASVHPAIL